MDQTHEGTFGNGPNTTLDTNGRYSIHVKSKGIFF